MKLSISSKTYLKKLDGYGMNFDEDLKDMKSSQQKRMTNLHQDPVGSGNENGNCDSFKIILDNIDLHILTRDMTCDRQNRDIHWVNHSAVKNRVTIGDDAKEQTNILKLNNYQLLPSATDHDKLRKDFIHLVSCIIVKHIPCMQFLQEICPLHIPHKYSVEMSRKSEKVC